MHMPDNGEAWAASVRCTGAGNQVAGCGATLAAERGDVFNSRTYARPIPTVECPGCGAWTDLEPGRWPGTTDDLRPLVRRHPVNT